MPRPLRRAIDRAMGNEWSQQAELAASDGAQGDDLGYSVVLSADGTEPLVGAYGHGYDAIGAAYVFTESGGTWTQVAEFTDPEGDPLDNYAQSVALSGDALTALVGSPYGYYTYGAVFEYHDDNGTWSEQAEITASGGDQGDEFGYKEALSTHGTKALVAADGHNTFTGIAYVFDDSNGSWTQTAELSPSDGGVLFQFGHSIGFSGNGTVALVGEPCWPDPTVCYGASYVFSESGGAWSQTAEILDPDGQGVNDAFGFGVALPVNGSTALVAGADFSPDAIAHVFTGSGGTWTQSAELTPSNGAPGDLFGASMALSSQAQTALVGAPGLNSSTGAAYVYTQPVAQAQALFRPSLGPPGTTTHLLGADFTPAERVDLSIGRLTGHVHANANGNFDIALRVPNVPRRTYTLTAVGETSGLSAQASFTVTSSTPGVTPSGSRTWVIGGLRVGSPNQ